MRLRAGDVAVITGAGSGIGRAAALALAKKGCDVVLADLDEQAAARVAELAAGRYGVRAASIGCDVRSDADVGRLFGTVVRDFGGVDVAVLNAGIGYYARVEETPADDLARLFEVNVLGVQRCVVAAIPLMRAQGRGALAITGSVNGKVAWPYHGAYSATKFALAGLAQGLRMELGGSGVSCTLVLPANVRTGFYAAAQTDGYNAAPIGPSTSAAQVARSIVRGIERGAAEVYAVPVGLSAGARLGLVFPGIAESMARRWMKGRRDGGVTWEQIETAPRAASGIKRPIADADASLPGHAVSNDRG
jgi:short-subunit dehydrogenase